MSRAAPGDLSVSRITVRKAIDGLVSEGLLVRRRGLSNFINTRIEKNFAKLTSFSEDMRARKARSRPRKRCGCGCRRARRCTVFTASAMPTSCRCAWNTRPSRQAACRLWLSVDISMYDALELAGNRPVRALQRLSALLLTGEQAALLQAQEGDAGLSVERLGFLRDGSAVEFCRSYFRGDMYDFVAELTTS